MAPALTMAALLSTSLPRFQSVPEACFLTESFGALRTISTRGPIAAFAARLWS